jgi:hypothetical protein
MTGSGPDDGDIIEMSPERPRRTWAGRTWLGRSWAERTGAIGRRSRLVLIVAGACVLLAAGGTLAAVRLSSRGPADPALEKLITEVTTAPSNATDHVVISASTGAFSGTSGFGVVGSSAYSSSLSVLFAPATPVNGPALTAGGKPEVLYVATEYCPYCVAESWPLVVALSRFGEFSGLRTSRSARFDNVLPIDGWTFYGSSYSSPYLTFVPVEIRSNALVNQRADPDKARSYRVLQQLTPAEKTVLDRLDHGRGVPFVDFGGRATLLSSGVPPDALAGLTWSQIAASLRRPGTPAGFTILAAADVLTAEFCTLTGNRPATACPK